MKMKNQKLISSQNLKKCLRDKHQAPRKGLIALLAFAWFCCWMCLKTVQAQDLATQLKADIHSKVNRSPSFENLTQAWEKKYGTQAFGALIQIASDRKNPDSDRYIALMSAAKLGGKGAASSILAFLKDSSWMIRGGALRILAAFGSKDSGEAIIPLIHDPALVVRVEAVETLSVLKPKGTAEALVSAIEDRENYHAGKAQWVPQKALRALATLDSKDYTERLKPTLHSPLHKNDPEFRKLLKTALSLSR
jgi:hypothetical protein